MGVEHSSSRTRAGIFPPTFHCRFSWGSFLRRLYVLWSLMYAVEMKQSWIFLWMCSLIWWSYTRPCCCATPPSWRYVQICGHTASQDPFPTLSQIQNRSVCFRNILNKTSCICKAVLRNAVVRMKRNFLWRCELDCEFLEVEIGLEKEVTLPCKWRMCVLQGWNDICGQKENDLFTYLY